MAQVLVSGTLPPGVSPTRLTGNRQHRIGRGLPDDYPFESDLEPYLRQQDGFVFMPDGDPLMAISAIVAKRIEPQLFRDKPIVLVQPDADTPHPMLPLLEELHARRLMKEAPEEVVRIARTPEDVPGLLRDVRAHRLPPVNDDREPGEARAIADEIAKLNAGGDVDTSERTVAVFSSASTIDPHNLAMAKELGEMFARNGWGMTFGGANVSSMGETARAAKDGHVHVLGVATAAVWKKNRELDTSNGDMPMHELRLVDNIYQRMHEILMPEPGKPVDAIVTLPGGIGSVQETLAVLQMRKREPEMRDVPMLLVNDRGAWEKFLPVAALHGFEPGRDFEMVDTIAEAELVLKPHMATHTATRGLEAGLGAVPNAVSAPDTAGDVLVKPVGEWKAGRSRIAARTDKPAPHVPQPVMRKLG